MKNEIPITITRAVFFLLFSLFFFGTITTKAQKINKLTKDNKRTGIWKKYYTNKRIRYEGTFIDGNAFSTQNRIMETKDILIQLGSPKALPVTVLT